MSLGSATNRNNHTGDGSTTTFSYTFKIFADADLQVVTRDSGTTTDVVKTLTTDYTVTGAGLSSGGTVVFTTAPASSAKITIRRVRTITQSTDLRNQGTFSAQDVEDALDHQAMISQQQDDEIDRSLKLPVTEKVASFDTTLPENVTESSSFGKALIVNAAGDGFALSSVSGSGAVADTDDVTYNSGATGAVNRTATNRLAERVSIFDFGAVGDGTTDDSAAIALAVTHAKVSPGSELYCPSGFTIKIDSQINLKGVRNINFESDILVDSDIGAVPVLLGGVSDQIGGRWWFKDVTDGTAPFAAPPARAIVQISGAKSVDIQIGNCNYLKFESDAATAVDNGILYNTTKMFGVIDKLELATGDSSPTIEAINENTFYGGRLIRLIIDGTVTSYPHNHNKFVDSNFESSDVDVQFNGQAASNRIIRGRFEDTAGSSGITFGAKSRNNVVERTWGGDDNIRDMFAQDRIPFTNAGRGNVVLTDLSYKYAKVPLFQLNATTGLLATATESVAPHPALSANAHGIDSSITGDTYITPGLDYLQADGFEYLGLTQPIKVSLGDCIAFDADFDGSLARPIVFVMDSDQKPLLSEDSDGDFVVSASTTFNTTDGYYNWGSDQTADGVRSNVLCVVRSECVYVRVGFVFGSGSGHLFRSLSAFLWTRPLFQGNVEASIPAHHMRTLDGTPTMGYVPANTAIWDRGAQVMRRVSYAQETRVSGTTQHLNETDFATHAKWDATNDWDDTGGNGTFTWSANQTSTLTQTAANQSSAPTGSTAYRLTYTCAVSAAPDGDMAMTLTTGMASTALTMPIAAGTHNLDFTTASSPGDFVIQVISGTDTQGTFTVDDVTLKPQQAVATAGTSVTVVGIDTVANNDVCGVVLDNGATHWTTVSGLSSSTFTIDAVPASRHIKEGARIAFNRWVPKTLTVTAAGPTDDLDLTDVDVISVDTTSNNVTLGGVLPASLKSGQIVRITVADNSNNTVVEHNEASGNIDFFLNSGGDETLTAAYGGWTFRYDGVRLVQV